MSSEKNSLLHNSVKTEERPLWVKIAGGTAFAVLFGGAIYALIPNATSTSSAVKTTTGSGANNATTNDTTTTQFPAKYAEFYKEMFANMDESVDPCVDFYQYACGGWLKAHELTETESNLDTSFSIVNKNNDKIIKEIMASKPAVIDPFYQSCMQEGNVNSAAIQDIASKLNHIANITALDELLHYAGVLSTSTGTSSFFEAGASFDPKNASSYVLEISQGGLTFPSPNYYAQSAKYLPTWEEYITSLSTVEGFQGVKASDILAFETKLANISLPEDKLRDPWTTYHKFNLSQAVVKFSIISNYLHGMKPSLLNQTSLSVMVPTPTFFESLADLLKSTDLKLLKAYLAFHLIDARAPYLGETYRLSNHKFWSVLNGLPAKESREVYCMNLVKTSLGEYLGQLYMDKAFDKSAKTQAQELIKQIESAMVNVVNNEDWLDPPTRRVALDKISKVANFIGGPDSFEHIPFNISSSFIENVQHLNDWSVSKSLGRLGQPVDHTQWDMFAFTADAYNDPTANKMVFPAAFLQKPVYGAKDFPAVANYARIGVVMGHELTHGFDDAGRNFDPLGQLADWWTVGVKETFQRNADCMAEQYSKFPVYSDNDGKTLLGHVNGRLTLGENIADNGGLKLSYMAYQQAKKADPSIADIGYDDAKLYFTAFVQGWWCKKQTDDFAINSLAVNPHSPPQWRARGPIMNSQVFADAFQCPVGSPMNPAKKCVVW